MKTNYFSVFYEDGNVKIIKAINAYEAIIKVGNYDAITKVIKDESKDVKAEKEKECRELIDTNTLLSVSEKLTELNKQVLDILLNSNIKEDK